MGRAKSSERLYLRGGTWWCWGYDVKGKRWDRSTKQLKANKQAARLALREIEREYATDSGAARSARVTLIEALDARIASMRSLGKKETSIYAVTVHCRHLVEVLGPRTPLTSITHAVMTRYMVQRIGQGAAMHTIHKEVVQVGAAWRWQHRLGRVPPVPGDLMPDELKGGAYKPRERHLSHEEQEALARALDSSGREQEERRSDYVTMWCFTGARRAELYDYQPGDYDPERREWRVRGTKTDGADRTIPVPEEAHEILVRRAERGFPVWANYRRDILAACKRAQIKPATCNDFRRTFCTWMAAAGVPERHCAELMGHASTAMVRKVYARIRTASLHGAVAAISRRAPTPPQPAAPSSPPAAPAAEVEAKPEGEKPARSSEPPTWTLN